jgi:serine/threonine-protein kinase
MRWQWYKGAVSASIHALPVTIGDLTLIDRLGAGGMAEVFLATRPSPLGGVEKVVVKRMLPHLAQQENYRRLFRREAAIGRRIVDRYVVRTHGLVEDDGGLMLIVEFIDGATLRTLAREAYERQTTLPLPVVLQLFAHAARGLAAIHATTDEQGRPFVHRDISPDNLMVGRDGVTRVLDFGVARPGGEGVLTRTGEIRGKLPYMPPEQLDARGLDGRTDLYALGVSLFWMLTGRRPFVHRSEVQLIRAIMQERAPRVRTIAVDVPPALDGLIDELLQKDPARRPADALAVAARLEGLGADSDDAVAAFVARFLALDPVTTSIRRRGSQASTSLAIRDAARARTSLHDERVPTQAPTLSASSEWGGHLADVNDGADDVEPLPSSSGSSSTSSSSMSRTSATSATRAPHDPLLEEPRASRRVVAWAAAASAVVALGLGGGVALLAPSLSPSAVPMTSVGTASMTSVVPAAAPAASVSLPSEAVTPVPSAPRAPSVPSAPEVVAAAPPSSPTPPATTTKTVSDRPSLPVRTVVVVGAPAGTVWRSGGRELGRGDGALGVPAGVERLEAAWDGARISVVVDGPQIVWDELPRGVLSVRAHEGTVHVGASAWEVPAKIRLMAGRYVVRFVDDAGHTSEHRVDVRAGATTVLNVAEAP